MKKILIVEDEPDIQELLRTYLEDAGYAAAVAGDGVAALDLFHAQPFDLVLLDVLLPKIDGFGVCELIRRQSQVPILMLTALDGEEEQLRGFGLDIDDYRAESSRLAMCSSSTLPVRSSMRSLWPGSALTPVMTFSSSHIHSCTMIIFLSAKNHTL